MIKRNPSAAQRARSEKDMRNVKTYLVIFACLLLLVCGFFLAGRQHFSSMDYSMRNSKLRKQIDDLEAEKRRLILAREISLSPAEIKKAAMKTGLFENSAAKGQLAVVTSVTKDKATPPPVSDAKAMVIKTVAVTPAAPKAALAMQKVTKPVAKTTMSAE